MLKLEHCHCLEGTGPWHLSTVRVVQAKLVGIGLLRRLRSPMPQLDHVLGLYPETAGKSSQERFAFWNTARCFGLVYERWACCVRHLTCQVLMDLLDRINQKGDWHSTSRLLIGCALYYHAILIITVTRANGSLVIFREGFSQIAGLSRWQVAIANRRYHQGSDHVVGISYRLLNR